MEVIDHHTALSERVIETMLYFDIFSYPLKAGEVHTFLHVNSVTEDEIKEALDRLAGSNLLFRFGDLYSLHDDKANIERRIRGNLEAEKWIGVARRQARLIARFPFVRAVMASGSLSKGYMDEKSDLDFFLITRPNRLWIARTLLVLYKRIFLLGSHKNFCVNYFVDALHLEIEEKNIFTATELVTLIPLYNSELYVALLGSNQWVREFLPNFKTRNADEADPGRVPVAKQVVELLLSPVGAVLDRFFLHLSLRRWKRLYEKQFDKKEFELAFKSRRHVSKNHPNNYQRKILDLYRERILTHSRRRGGQPS